MKKPLVLLALAAIGFAGCNGGFKKGAKGLLYNINVDKSGTNMKNGDFVLLDFTLKNDADSVLYSTYDAGHPVAMAVQPRMPGEIIDVFQYLSEGDSATIKVNVDSVYKTQKPPGFKGKYLNYGVKIEKVIAKGNMPDSTFQRTVTAYMKTSEDKIKDAEPAKITKYIADNKLTVTKTASGLNYVITKPGTGPTPKAGDTIAVNYIGKFVSGKVFETNVKEEAVKAKTYNAQFPYQPIRIPVGVGAVIHGWDEGMMLLNKGAKATLVVPSELAYGERGNQLAGPYTPLVFEVELVSITPPNPNAPKPPLPQISMPQAQPVKPAAKK